MPVAASVQGLPPAAVAQAVLGGGDAYELCFTAAPADHDRVLDAAARAGVPVTAIGHIDLRPGIVVLDAGGRPMAELPRGFDHFPAS
ncbi:thiamine-phosphate kinase, partial [Bordetella petrii]|nr:thiamine-phosphate kinase [Bordetella petrii]